MKRSVLVVSVLSTLLLVASAHAQTGTYDPDREHNSRYVLVEKSGDDITGSMYSTTTEVRERIKVIQQGNVRNARANQPVLAELKKLKSELAAKERKVKSTKEGPDRDAVQREVETLKAEVNQKEGQLKPIIRYLPEKRFNNVELAQKYINEIAAAAARAKQEAEKKRLKQAETEAAEDDK